MKLKLRKFIFSLAFITIFMILMTNTSFASDNTKNSSSPLLELKVPQSAVSELLGSSPNAISKPDTPKKLGIELLSAYNGNNVSVELAPYWYFPDTEYTSFQQYYYTDNIIQSTLQNLSISITTIDIASGQAKALGYGMKTMLLQGHPRISFEELHKRYLKSMVINNILRFLKRQNYKDFNTLMANIDSKVNEYFEAVKQKNDVLPDDSIAKAQYIESIKKIIITEINTASNTPIVEINGSSVANTPTMFINQSIEKYSNQSADEQSNLVKEFRKANTDRIGFIVEVAAATTGKYQNNNWNSNIPWKQGYWLTTRLPFEDLSNDKDPQYDILAIYRSINDQELKQTQNDYGGKLLFHFGKINIGGEYLWRNYQNSSTANATERYDLIIEYKLDEDFYLTGSIGKDFDSNPLTLTNNPNMIAIFGINWGFGNSPSLDLSKK